MFQLASKFDPKGDQPNAIKFLSEGIKKGDKGQVLLGATGTGKTFTMANIIQELQRPALIMCHNKTLAAQLCSEFQEFFPNNSVCYFVSYYDYYQPEAYVAKSDTYIEKETSINEEIEKYRHAATHSLMTRKDVIIIASVSAIYGLGDSKVYGQLAVDLKVGEEYTRDVLFRRLVDLQYTRAMGSFKQGMFNVLGDTIEIFPPSSDNVLRLEFFGDELERIEEADGFTGEVYGEMQEVHIFPASHNVTTKERIEEAIPKIQEELEQRHKFFVENEMIVHAERIKTRTEYDIEMMRETGYCSGIENYVRYLNNSKAGDPPPTLMNYFPKDFLMFIDESHITVPQVRGMFNGNLARKKNLVDFGFRLPSAYDNRPLQYPEFEKFMKHATFVSATPQQYEFDYSENKVVEQIIRPTGLLDPKIEIRHSEHQVDDVLKEIKIRIKKKERVLVTTTTKKLAEKMAEYLDDNGVSAKYLHSEIDTFDRVEILRQLRLGSRNDGIDVIVGINLLREGLDLPEVSLVAIFDADKEGFLRSRDALLQIVGRAARNVDGTVLMYSRKIDGKLNITKAMKACIEETDRRREKQSAHNKKHGITPESIKKAINLISSKDEQKPVHKNYDTDNLKKDEVKRLIEELEAQMDMASQNYEFEKAGDLRDQIEILKRSE
jgi:excinuclease ABC subunit B